MRALLHGAAHAASAATAASAAAGGHGHAHEGGGHEYLAHGGGALPSTLTLRLVAIVAILLAGLLGGLPPIFLRHFQSPDATAGRLARAFGGGVIVALALVHVLPEGIEMLSALTPFPLGAVLAAAGVLALLALDYAVTACMAPEPFKRRLRAALRAAAAGGGAGGVGRAGKDAAAAAGGGDCGGGGRVVADATAASDQEVRGGGEGEGEGEGGSFHEEHCHACATETASGAGVVSHPAHLLHSHHHTPSHPISGLRQLVACYTLEAGCVFHSVVIGIGIGVMSEDASALAPLIIAMVFHQALEGIALGAVLATAAAISRLKKLLMVFVYSLTLPAGIAVGIAAAVAYDPASPVALGVQGGLSAFSAGLLLHIGMYQMIGEEVSRHDLLVRPWLGAGVFLAVALGVACMAVIALWG